MPTPVAVIGSTGLVGTPMLATLLASDAYAVTTITRRAPKATSAALNAIVDADTTKWAPALSAAKPTPSTVFSALGTTRDAAGGLANQWKIDHDLNIELAKAAKAAGAKTFVFISAAGTRSFLSSFAPYSKMKIGVEDAIKDLGFETGIVVRPGLIRGTRAKENTRTGEVVAEAIISRLPQGLMDKYGQDVEVIARAAVRAAQIAEEGKAPSKFWAVETADIIRLGRTEWPVKADSKPAQ